MKKKYWIFTILAAILLVTLLFPISCGEEKLGTGTIKFNYTMPPGSAVAVGYEWWADEFEKRTDGRYTVETYPLSSLLDDAGSLDAVKGGVCEIIMTSTGSHQTDFPLASLTGLPMLCFHKKGVAKEEYLASFKALKELYKIKEVGDEFKDYHLIAAIEIDPTYLITKNKKVVAPEDLKGLKVGGASGAMEDLMKAYGAAGVFQIPPQAYMNMDKGVTDAAFMTYAMIGPYKMYDVANYILTQTFTAGTLLVLTSHSWYDSLAKSDQKIFDETWEQAMDVCAQGMYDENVHSKPEIEASGITITHPTPEQSAAWEAACTKYAYPTWAKMCQDLGYSSEVTDKVMKKWQDLIKEYTTQK
jgi:TRAP-type C4-dicarboxylate transport system substrate-binding protein